MRQLLEVETVLLILDSGWLQKLFCAQKCSSASTLLVKFILFFEFGDITLRVELLQHLLTIVQTSKRFPGVVFWSITVEGKEMNVNENRQLYPSHLMRYLVLLPVPFLSKMLSTKY